jgi:hypothetical protein
VSRWAPAHERLWGRTARRPNGCWEWQGAIYHDGYGAFGLNGKQERAHRAAWMLAAGPIPPGLYVCHHCDNRLCVNPAHLFLGTHQDNMRDGAAKGRFPGGPGSQHGEANRSARLRALDVETIRERIRQGEQKRVLAHEFGVAESTIGDIAHGRTWTKQ